MELCSKNRIHRATLFAATRSSIVKVIAITSVAITYDGDCVFSTQILERYLQSDSCILIYDFSLLCTSVVPNLTMAKTTKGAAVQKAAAAKKVFSLNCLVHNI